MIYLLTSLYISTLDLNSGVEMIYIVIRIVLNHIITSNYHHLKKISNNISVATHLEIICLLLQFLGSPSASLCAIKCVCVYLI